MITHSISGRAENPGCGLARGKEVGTVIYFLINAEEIVQMSNLKATKR
jgi:hypothetical protein